jgi:hypothetical protein
MAKLSGDPRISVEEFRTLFVQEAKELQQQERQSTTSTSVTSRNIPPKRSKIPPRACRKTRPTALDLSHPLWPTYGTNNKNDKHNSFLIGTPPPPPPRPTHVYCVEAGTATAKLLQRTRDRMMSVWFADIDDEDDDDHPRLTMTHAAVGDHNGMAWFPKLTAGSERGRLCVTEKKAQNHDTNDTVLNINSTVMKDHNDNHNNNIIDLEQEECEVVPMYTVDTYVRTFVKEMNASSDTLIDFLSVDVEGFDWVVLGLGGADHTLPRVKYLEFEYHKVGVWPQYNLSEAVNSLHDIYGFVCYYAAQAQLWRLTRCFQDYFNEHRWSNVACVNPRLNPTLAVRMEQLFQSQLLDSR